MSSIASMMDLDLSKKRLLIREDFNVPMEAGKITNDTRIRAALPTIEHALKSNAAVILISHLGQPKEGVFEPQLSLEPVAKHLSTLLNRDVRFASNWLDGVECDFGEVVLCENVRFNSGEKSDDLNLAQKMAVLCDIFVMDAFASAHRAQASTHGVAKMALEACAGPLLTSELNALSKALKNPQHPLIGIVGGSKVSTKLTILHSLINNVDQLIVGGGIANTFLAASGYPVGKSLYEPDLLEEAKKLMENAKTKGAQIPLPIDVVVATEISDTANASVKFVDDVAASDMILDIGPKTIERYTQLLQSAKTIVWNGPVGVFEKQPFAAGTKALANAIADSSAFSLAGGGDTIAAIDTFNVNQKISYISTGGGAFLEFLEGKTLPAVAVLEERATR